MSSVFYSFSGGMESAAMVSMERERIKKLKGQIVYADTGKQFPEMADSIAQIQDIIGLPIITVPRRITFDEFLFEKGGMLRRGMTDCSRRMKRTNISRYIKQFPKPWEINLGFNTDEDERADAFTERNERPWCHWRYPLMEAFITRARTREMCIAAGFTILVDMYDKMGRFDCFWCPNQRPSQAQKVVEHYPDLAKEWAEAEAKKGHHFMALPIINIMQAQDSPSGPCSCFGGTEPVLEED